MSTIQKRGFRLPWSGDHDREDPEDAAQRLADALEQDQAIADRGHPFQLGTGSEEGEADMVSGSDTTVDPRPGAAHGVVTSQGSGSRPAFAPDAQPWPAADHRPVASPAATPAEPPTAEPPPATQPAAYSAAAAAVPRRENPLVAGLVRAMRDAAEASRVETMTRLRAEITTQSETIREHGTAAAQDIRKQADEDVAEIREWSKAELARVRQETDERIAERRARLDAELEEAVAAADRTVAELESTVGEFEAVMNDFFERLLTESDPARLATLAEQAPEPPDLAAMAGSSVAMPAPEVAVMGGTSVDASDGEPQPVESDSAPAGESEQDTAAQADGEASAGEAEPAEAPTGEAATGAAEAIAGDGVAQADETPLGAADAEAAEAAAEEGLELPDEPAWSQAETPQADGPAVLGVVVRGLNSVAGISAFKHALSELQGVQGVSVTSGERGSFVFTVSHDGSGNIRKQVAELPRFGVAIVADDGDRLTVTAQEPAA
jgi:hypothetical protein